jgi:hypothetical protein
MPFPSLAPAVFKFAGAGFAAPAAIDTRASANPVVEQDAGKRMHAVYPNAELGHEHRIAHAVSDNGTIWREETLVTDAGAADRARLAVAPDHSGAAVYAAGGQIRLARIGASLASAPSTATATSKTIKVAGGKVTLAAPKKCVPARRAFSVHVTAKRGGSLSKITRVVFYFDGHKQPGADTKAPFSNPIQQLFSKGGTAHQIKARITIRLRGGKTTTRTVAVHFTYCPE